MALDTQTARPTQGATSSLTEAEVARYRDAGYVTPAVRLPEDALARNSLRSHAIRCWSRRSRS